MAVDSRDQNRSGGVPHGADSSTLDTARIDAAVTALGERGADALSKAGAEGLPDGALIIEWAERLRRVVLHTRDLGLLRAEVPALADMTLRLLESVELPAGKAATAITETLIATLPEIRQRLSEDVEAAFEGDPAARSYAEVVASYPAIRAISTYRLAHELQRAASMYPLAGPAALIDPQQKDVLAAGSAG